ncbi:hypothetical protein EKH55_1731 [Sinorhizobium alkalisoli]|nr:hypothetical protein EKH55_1731 [Sinorhizobium alkalisoli]
MRKVSIESSFSFILLIPAHRHALSGLMSAGTVAIATRQPRVGSAQGLSKPTLTAHERAVHRLR